MTYLSILGYKQNTYIHYSNKKNRQLHDTADGDCLEESFTREPVKNHLEGPELP